ncbi:MAG: lipoprotein localization factor LolB [Alcaligenaceae bacterium]|nr:lipoprotein localization factor LolB [Alcaligenaceae bacterium]
MFASGVWSHGFRVLFLVLCVSVLAACATPSAIQGPATDAFQRSGRFAVSVDDIEGGSQAVQGGFAWYDSGRHLILDLANPLGSTLARVEVFPDRAVLTRSDGSTQEAATADALIAQVVGAAIPVSGLRSWLKGDINPALTSGVQQDNGSTRFVQDGWSVALSRHDTHGPRLVHLTRKEGLRSISVRLVVDAS